MNAMGRKYPFGQKMKRRGHFHIGAHNTKYILPVCTQKVKHICTKIKETSGNFPAIWQTPGRAFSLTTEKPHDKIQNILSAGVVELVDSVDLGSSGIAVQVRVLSPAPSKGYKKDVSPETPDFIGGFAVSTAEKTASDFVDVKKILFPF